MGPIRLPRLHRPTILVGAFVVCCTVLTRAGEIAFVDGERHIVNGPVPSQGLKTINLVEQWRVGGADDEILFGILTRVLADDAGDVYLLDTQLSQAHVYSATGAHVRTLAREGEGPGEVRMPGDMVFLPDGTLGLVQVMPGKIIRITRSGMPAGTLLVGGDDATGGDVYRLIDAQCRGGTLALSGMQFAQGRVRNHFVAGFDAEGRRRCFYYDQPRAPRSAAPSYVEDDKYSPVGRGWTVGPDGRVYIPHERNAYRIRVYNPDGSLDRVIRREFQSWPRTERQRARATAMVAAIVDHMPPGTRTEVSATEPDITSLYVLGDGTLWVKTSRSTEQQPEGIMATYDVFDPDGHFVRQVAVACPGDGRADELLFLGDDRVLLVTGLNDGFTRLQVGVIPAEEGEEEPEPMMVVAYRIH